MVVAADDMAAAVERAVVIAEAKILVQRLAVYADLVSQWFREEEAPDAVE